MGFEYNSGSGHAYAPEMFVLSDAVLRAITGCVLFLRPGATPSPRYLATDFSTWRDPVDDTSLTEYIPSSPPGTPAEGTVGLLPVFDPDESHSFQAAAGYFPTSDYTLAFACEVTNNTTTRSFFRGPMNIYFQSSSGDMKVYNASDSAETVSLGDRVNSFNYWVIGFTSSTKLLTVRLNGVEVLSATVTSDPSSTAVNLFGNGGITANLYHKGDTGAIVGYSRDLTAAGNEADLATVENYYRQGHQLY